MNLYANCSNLNMCSIVPLIHHDSSSRLIPVHVLKSFDLQHLNPPSSLVPQVIVHLIRHELIAIEVEHIICNGSHVLLLESPID